MSNSARTFGAISAYRLLGRSGNRWCSIWWLRLPLIRCIALPPEMFAAPSICRRYHSPLVSPSIERFSKVSTPSGKCPHRMIELLHRLRTTFAVKFAARVGRNEPVGQRQGRVDQVVLGRLLADLAQHALQPPLELRVLGLLLLDRGAELEVVGRDAVLEEDRVDEVPQRLARGTSGARAAPRPRARCRSRGRCPCRSRSCRCGAARCASAASPWRASPCPTPRWSSGSSGRASSPTGRAARCARSPCSPGSSRRSGRRCRRSHAGGKIEASSTTRLPSSSERWVLISLRMYAASSAPRDVDDLLRGSRRAPCRAARCPRRQVGDRVLGSSSGSWSCHSWRVGDRGCRDQRSKVHGPAAALMQVWTRTPPGSVSPGTAVVRSPLRRSRTAPLSSGVTQL